jgi:hypothetical protein
MLAAASLTVTAPAERGDQNGGAENVSGKINWWRRRWSLLADRGPSSGDAPVMVLIAAHQILASDIAGSRS